jgi:hypothetical protein
MFNLSVIAALSLTLATMACAIILLLSGCQPANAHARVHGHIHNHGISVKHSRL